MGKLNKKFSEKIGKVYKKHYKLFIWTADRIVHNEEASQDIVHKAILYIINKTIRQGKLHYNLKYYICLTISGRAKNWLRDNKKMKYISNSEIEKLEKENKLRDFKL